MELPLARYHPRTVKTPFDSSSAIPPTPRARPAPRVGPSRRTRKRGWVPALAGLVWAGLAAAEQVGMVPPASDSAVDRLRRASLVMPQATHPRSLRTVAEWEPALGTLIAWPLEIPDALVAALARNDILFVFVRPEREDEARSGLLARGVPAEHLVLIPSTVESEWTRDYGPHQVFDTKGCLTVVDSVYINTPVFSRDQGTVARGEALDYYNETFPGDDRTPQAFAELRDLPRWETSAYVTGGNFLVDGFGAAFVTKTFVDENNVILSTEELRAILRGLMGITDLQVLPNTEPWGIQHIDCWLKLVDPETLLVKRAPPGHSEAAAVERNVERLRQLKTPWGRPYRILRIDTPEHRPGEVPAYTNALILNRTVYVPLFGDAAAQASPSAADAAALAAWRAALPGYEVLGFPFQGWRPWDALHCRTRAVFDPGLLRLVHGPLHDGVPASQPIAVQVRIDALSGASLLPDQLAVEWRLAGAADAPFVSVPLRPAAAASEPGDGPAYVAELPAQAPGAVVEYFIRAADASGRRETLPRSAPAGTYRFVVTR